MSLREKLKSASKDDILDRPGSPIIDVETLSDEEYPKESTQSQRLSLTDATSNLDPASGDQKVLTLAEQFLAAMPARIKHPNDHSHHHFHHGDHGDHHEVMQWDDCSCDASQSDDLGIGKFLKKILLTHFLKLDIAQF